MKTIKILTVIILLSVFAFNITGLKAQQVLNVYAHEHTNDRKPIPYQYLREADVMWSKTVWRIIELKEKMNHPLYYPTEPQDYGKSRSLIDLLIWAIDNRGLRVFDESVGDEFATPTTMNAIQDKLGGGVDTIWVKPLEGDGPPTQKIVEDEYHTSDVKQLMIKEMWFFDKQRSVLEVRIIGISPIYYKPDTEGAKNINEEVTKFKRKQLFWVYYPDVRGIFANHEAVNSKNAARGKTYEDIFFLRLFSSTIVQESNAYGNRRIADYTQGLETLLEAERVKESIFNFEQDLWEY